MNSKIRKGLTGILTSAALIGGATKADAQIGRQCTLQPGTTVVGSVVTVAPNGRTDRLDRKPYTDWDSVAGDIEAGFFPTPSNTNLYLQGSHVESMEVGAPYNNFVKIDTLNVNGNRELRANIDLAKARAHSQGRRLVVPIKVFPGATCASGINTKSILNFTGPAAAPYNAAAADRRIEAKLDSIATMGPDYFKAQQARDSTQDARLGRVESAMEAIAETVRQYERQRATPETREQPVREQPTRVQPDRTASRRQTTSGSNMGYFTVGPFIGVENTDLTPRDEGSIPGEYKTNFKGAQASLGVPLGNNGVLYANAHAATTSGHVRGKIANPRTGEIPSFDITGKDIGAGARIQYHLGPVGVGGGVSLRDVQTDDGTSNVSQTRFDAELSGLIGSRQANAAVGARFNTNGADATPEHKNVRTLFARAAYDGRLVSGVPLTAMLEAYRQDGTGQGIDFKREGIVGTIQYDVVSGKTLGVTLFGQAQHEKGEFGQSTSMNGLRGGVAGSIYFGKGRK